MSKCRARRKVQQEEKRAVPLSHLGWRCSTVTYITWVWVTFRRKTMISWIFSFQGTYVSFPLKMSHFNGVSDILVTKYILSSPYFVHDSVQLRKYKVFRIVQKECVLVSFNQTLGTAEGTWKRSINWQMIKITLACP